MDDNNDSDGTDMVDIFEDLDTNLLEILHRGNQATLFQNVPIDQHDNAINRLNLVLERNLNRAGIRQTIHHTNNNRYSNDNKFFYLIWVLTYLPIPAINYKLIWRSYRPSDISQFLLRVVHHVARFSITFLRIVFAYLVLESNIRDCLKLVFKLSNIYTFSDNFLIDIITYVLQDNQYIIERQIKRGNKKNDIFDFANNDEIYNKMSNWQILNNIILNIFSDKVRVACSAYESSDEELNNQWLCHLDDRSLIFKFSKVFEEHIPFLTTIRTNKWFSMLKIVTIAFYTIYAIGGNIVSMNIMLFYMNGVGRRFLKYGKFIKSLSSLIWDSLNNEIF